MVVRGSGSKSDHLPTSQCPFDECVKDCDCDCVDGDCDDN